MWNLGSISIIGLDRVFDAESIVIRRVVWATAILCGAILTSYQLYDRFSYYFQYPTMTTMQIERHDTLLLPSLRICSRGYDRNWAWLAEQKLTDKVKRFEARFKEFAFLSKEHHRQLSDVENPWYTVLQNNSIIGSNKYQYITIAGKRYRGKLNRTLRPGKYIGVCSELRTLEDEDGLFDIGPGEMNGFRWFQDPLKAKYGSNETPPVLPGTAAGVYITFFHPRGQAQYSTGSKNTVFAPVNAHTTVSLTGKRYTFAEPPHGECSREAGSTEACLHECALPLAVSGWCGCLAANIAQGLHPCPTANTSACAYRTYFTLMETPSLQNEHCAHCRQQCRLDQYEIVARSAAMDFNGGVSVVASFASSSLEHFQQQPIYNGWALLCDVGGALGLFLGSAIFTLLEIADYAFVKATNISK